MAVNMRTLRLKLVWLLVIPFLWFASPTPSSLLAGFALGVVGLAIRAWAAGTIQKEAQLTTTGPYAYTRNPLYIGSLVLGVGITLGGGRLAWVGLFLGFYLAVYTRTMAGEVRLLAELFGERYEHYAGHVPAFLPKLTPYRAPDGTGEGFSLGRYRRNNEWEAALGFALVFGYLAVRWWLSRG